MCVDISLDVVCVIDDKVGFIAMIIEDETVSNFMIVLTPKTMTLSKKQIDITHYCISRVICVNGDVMLAVIPIHGTVMNVVIVGHERLVKLRNCR